MPSAEEAYEILRSRGMDVTLGPSASIEVVAIPIRSTKKRKPRQPLLLPDAFVPPATWIVGIITKSSFNERLGIGAKMKLAKSQRQHLGILLRATMPKQLVADCQEAVAAGRKLLVTMTRIGGRRMDKGGRFIAMKHLEDELAAVIGIDDGVDGWVLECPQETGKDAANGRQGVRIEIKIGGDDV